MKELRVIVSGKIHHMTAGNLDRRTGMPAAAPIMPPAALSASCSRRQGVGGAGSCRAPNLEWQRRRPRVTLDAVRGAMTGHFGDIGSPGNLPLPTGAGCRFVLPAFRVKLLRQNF